ncbi:MAG: zinc-ribbon domain-containing protein [Treponema sp.]|nr:zinc-ribbon domain-containing protein [Treponema sp.]
MSEETVNSMKFCSNCGTELPQNVNFCPKCGAKAGDTKVKNEKSALKTFFKNPFVIPSIVAFLFSILLYAATYNILNDWNLGKGRGLFIYLMIFELASCYFVGQVRLGKLRPYYGTVGERVVLSVLEIFILIVFSIPLKVSFLPGIVAEAGLILSIACSLMLFAAFVVIPFLPVKFKKKCVYSGIALLIFIVAEVGCGVFLGLSVASVTKTPSEIERTEALSSSSDIPGGAVAITSSDIIKKFLSPQTFSYSYSMPSRTAKYIELDTAGVKRISIDANCDSDGTQLKFDLLPDLNAFNEFSNSSVNGEYTRWMNFDYLGKNYMREIELDKYPYGSKFYLALKNRNWAFDAFVTIKITYYYN